jgi:hypothetical protein
MIMSNKMSIECTAPPKGFIGVTNHTNIVFAKSSAHVQVSIRSSPHQAYATLIALDWDRKSFLFEVDDWGGCGFWEVLNKFYDTYNTLDREKFGQGDITPTQQQKLNVIMYMSMDVINCIEQIILVQPNPRSYARWYGKSFINGDTYSNLITRCACKCIQNSEIEIRTPAYTLTEFDPSDNSCSIHPTTLVRD